MCIGEGLDSSPEQRIIERDDVLVILHIAAGIPEGGDVETSILQVGSVDILRRMS